MPYPKNLLSDGEVIVHDLRPHWRALIVPALLFFVMLFVGFFLLARIDNSQARMVIVGGMVLFGLWFDLKPFLDWWTTNYVLTDRRIIIRSGLFVRRGRDMPLSRVNDVSFIHSPLERLLNSGTLYVESAGTNGQLVIRDVPNVEQIQSEVSRLRELDDERRRSQFAGDYQHPGPVTPPSGGNIADPGVGPDGTSPSGG